MAQNHSRSLPIAAVLVMALVAVPRTYAQARGAAAAQADTNGFKIGDVVEVDTAFGWVDATVLAGNGDNYQVRVNGVAVMKAYPLELHRKGAYTDRDHAAGLYALEGIVQVNVRGKGWIEGVVSTTKGLDYEVTFPDKSTAWATG